mmetsp:Transcript_13963/g.32438  ORF Transcript_13963/g.32438 Transcript_13963/m.32438 type:complete len:256 (+) Transcript_13963:5306-6073(+)
MILGCLLLLPPLLPLLLLILLFVFDGLSVQVFPGFERLAVERVPIQLLAVEVCFEGLPVDVRGASRLGSAEEEGLELADELDRVDRPYLPDAKDARDFLAHRLRRHAPHVLGAQLVAERLEHLRHNLFEARAEERGLLDRRTGVVEDVRDEEEACDLGGNRRLEDGEGLGDAVDDLERRLRPREREHHGVADVRALRRHPPQRRLEFVALGVGERRAVPLVAVARARARARAGPPGHVPPAVAVVSVVSPPGPVT